MAKITRVKQEIFGIDGPVGEFGQIGSDANGAATNTKDIATIQALSQYADGLFSVFPNADEPPIAEEINSMYYLLSTQIAQMMQAGIPEWETNTDYYVGSIVQVAGVFYISIDGVDPTPNQGNDPTSTTGYWKLAFSTTEVVNSQETFNQAIERVAVNQYKFRDDIDSIKFQFLTGGYLMTGGTSPLSGGDTWGYIETNNCKQIIFESGASIHMGNERGYLEVNTDDCYLQNVNIIGTGTVASAIAQSYLLNANRIQFMGCTSSTRLSNINFYVFRGSSTAAHNDYSKYVNCEVRDCISSNTIIGYYLIQNAINLIVKNIESTAGSFRGYSDCKYITNCRAEEMDAAVLGHGFYQCFNIQNCYAIDLDCGNDVFGFSLSDYVSNCYAIDLDSSGGDAYGYVDSNYVLNCHAYDIDSATLLAAGFWNCDNVTNCKALQIDHSGAVASQNAYGFLDCDKVSSSCADDIDTNGAGGVAYGFVTCKCMSACNATNCATHGFYQCTHVSASCADSNTFEGFNDCDGLVNNESTNNGRYGFRACNALSHNRATGNTTGQYLTSYADWGASQAAADTATGGYNG